jgi:acyl-coenzyme A thioesterase PaaI-like protein
VYPPPHQILSALGIEVAWRDAETLVGRALVEVELLCRGSAGPGMGALAPIVDLVAGSQVARATERDWLATSDLWMHERSPIETGPVELTTRLLRAGKRSAVAAVEVTSGGSPWTSCTVEFARIRREASAHATAQARGTGSWIRLGSGPLLDRPLDEACGLVVIDAEAGVVQVGRSPFVHNSIDTLQGGVMVLLADAAAVAGFGPDARVVDMQFRFLAQTGDGPATTRTEVVRSDAVGAMVNVELTDSADGRLVGWAVCRVEPANPA